MWNEFDTNLHISVIEIGLDHCNNIENIFQEIYIANNNNNKKRLTSSLNQKANSELVNARREEKRREEKRKKNNLKLTPTRSWMQRTIGLLVSQNW